MRFLIQLFFKGVKNKMEEKDAILECLKQFHLISDKEKSVAVLERGTQLKALLANTKDLKKRFEEKI